MRIPKIGEGKRGPDGHLLFLLRQAATIVARQSECLLADVGLTGPLYSALTMIASYPDLSSADLSRVSMLTAQSANETVQKLVATGLVGRRRDPKHGRVLRLQITDSGRERLARGRKLTDRLENHLLAQARGAGDKAVRMWLVGVATTLAGSPDFPSSRSESRRIGGSEST
jgi:DNA-binding MarR family transcriptional regulator